MLKIKSKPLTLQSVMDMWYKAIIVCLTRKMALLFLNIKNPLNERRTTNNHAQVLQALGCARLELKIYSNQVRVPPSFGASVF